LINNRQSGRRRGRGGGGNGPRPQGGGGRPDNGNRIDNRARGNAAQLLEKYRNLAADAQRQGDRVNTEYYLQFADHYFRVLSETRARQEEQGQHQQRRPQPADPFRDQFGDSDDGDEFGEEGETIRPGEQMMPGDRQGERQGDRQPERAERRPERSYADRYERGDREARGDRQADQRGERAQNDRGPNERGPNDRGQGDRFRSESGQTDRQNERPRYRDRGDETQAARRPYEDRAQPAPSFQAAAPDAPVADAGAAPAETPVIAAPLDPAPAAEAPRRRGRPPRRVEAAPVADATDAPATVDGLPPAIGTRAPVVANDADTAAPAPAAEEAPKPRRRRAARAAAPADEASAAE